VNVTPISEHTEAGTMEQIRSRWTGLDIRDMISNKMLRKQCDSPILRNLPENEPEVGAGESDWENMSQNSTKVCLSRTETIKSSGSVGIDFPERKKIVKGRQSCDMFHTEDVASSRASSPRSIVTEGGLLHEYLMESEPPKANYENMDGTQTSETDSCEITGNPKTSSIDSDYNAVCNKSIKKVQQPAEDEYSFNDEEEEDIDEGILSFYNVTMFHSPTVSQFEESLMKPDVLADNSSKHAGDLKCALFRHTEQNSPDLAAETSVQTVNQTPTMEQSTRKGSYFSIITTDNESHRVYTPRFNPPSKDEILSSLSEFCIPEYRHQEPFVSNFLDTANKKEVGNKVVKICSTSVLDLQPFVASSLNTVGIETWRKKWLQEFSYMSQRSLDGNSDLGISNMKPALASHREVVITPCKLPPNVTEVKLWLEGKQKLTAQNLREKDVESKVSRKMVMPLSPGQESVSDDDISLSPGTPRRLSFERSQKGNAATAHSTPQVASISHRLPSPSCTPIHNSKHEIAKLLLKRSRKGLKLDSPSQENMSSTLPLIREEPEETAADIDLECGAAKYTASSGRSSELASPHDASGTYKQQDIDTISRELRTVKPLQPTNKVNLQSTTEVGETKRNLFCTVLKRMNGCLLLQMWVC
jgi:hypothetical protein